MEFGGRIWGIRSLALAMAVLMFMGFPVSDTPDPVRPFGEVGVAAGQPENSSPAQDAVRGSVVLPVGSDLSDVVVDPTRPRAYVADRTNGRVLVIHLDTATLGPAIPVGAEPVGLAINPGADTLYAAHAGEMSIAAIDLVSLAVSRTLPTSFLASDIVAPTTGTLVVTVRDDGYDGANPYLLRSSDGAVLQTLPGGPNPPDQVHGNTMALLSGDRQHLYVGGTYDGFLRKYTRQPDDTWAHDWNWWFVYAIRDMALSTDGALVYVAQDATSGDPGLTAWRTSDLTFAGRVGDDRCAQSVDVLASYVVQSPCGVTLTSYDAARQPVGTVPASGAIERVRVRPDGLQFVVTAGSPMQDVELVSTVRIFSFGPSGFASDPTPEFSAEVTPLVLPVAEVDAALEVDSAAIPSTFDPGSRIVRGTPPSDLSEGDHNVTVRVSRSGFEVASDTWSYALDSLPPVLILDTMPSRVEVPSITVSGRAVDPHLASVNVSGSPAVFDSDGLFSASVSLTPVPGSHNIEVVARDAAGNRATARASVIFTPPEVWFLHPANHFRIRVPFNWTATGNTTLGGETVDVLLQAGQARSIFVASERRAVRGIHAEARATAQATLSELVSLPGFAVVSSPADTTVDGHPAARAAFRSFAGPVEVHQVLVIVVGAEWGYVWAIVGTMAAAEIAELEPVIEASIQSFDVLRAPVSPGSPMLLILVGIVGGVVAALVAGVLVRRRRHRSQAVPTEQHLHDALRPPP